MLEKCYTVSIEIRIVDSGGPEGTFSLMPSSACLDSPLGSGWGPFQILRTLPLTSL